VTDLPAAQFHTELIAAYPEAKVILTTRDMEAWYESVMSTVQKNRESWKYNFMKLLYPDGRLSLKFWKLWDSCWEGDFRKNGKRLFLKHNEQVRKEVEGRLLEFRVEQGWYAAIVFDLTSHL
jgi:hypothetical protein